MGESRSYTQSQGGNDNASATSEDSIRPPPRQHEQFSKVKTGTEALPADAFDPLKHKEIENFWHQIEFHFQPINQDHLRNFASIPINSEKGSLDKGIQLPLATDFVESGSVTVPPGSFSGRDKKRDIKREVHAQHHQSSSNYRLSNLSGGTTSSKVKQEANVALSFNCDTHNLSTSNHNFVNTNSYQRGEQDEDKSNIYSAIRTADLEVRASLNSFPYTQRLMAALLDANPNGTSVPTLGHNRSSSSRNGSGSWSDAQFWLGIGNEDEVRKYQNAVEVRVKNELLDRGWLDDDSSRTNGLDSEIRKEQTKLRDLKSSNRLRQYVIYSKIEQELRQQGDRRSVKRRNDQVEREYLEQMVGKMKKNKKSRAKFQKLLSKMFGHYKEKEKITEKNKKMAAAAAAAALDNDSVSIAGVNGTGIGGSSSAGLIGGSGMLEDKVRSGKKKKKKASNTTGSNINSNDLPSKSTIKGLTRKSIM